MSRFRTVERVIAEEMAKPYVYGESDCFFLGCRVVDALRPKAGLVEKYSGAYTSLAGAQKALRRRRCKSMAELLARDLELIAPAEASVGDIAVLDLDGVEHLAVCVGPRFMTRTEKGAAFHDLRDVSAAFRI